MYWTLMRVAGVFLYPLMCLRQSPYCEAAQQFRWVVPGLDSPAVLCMCKLIAQQLARLKHTSAVSEFMEILMKMAGWVLLVRVTA